MISPSSRVRGGVATLSITASVVVAALGIAAAVWGHFAVERAAAEHAATALQREVALELRDTARDRKSARIAAELKRKSDEADQRVLEEYMASEGYEPVGNGVYWKWAPEGEYSCGYWDCIGVLFYAVDGCPDSLYVEAAITHDGQQVGMTNELTTSLAEGQGIAILLEDHTGLGNGFKLTKVNCH